MLQESRLVHAAVGVDAGKTRSKRLESLLYALYFLPIFLVVSLLTRTLRLVRFSRMLRAIHRAIRLRDRVLYLEAFFPENAGYHYRTQKWIEVLRESGFNARAEYVLDKKSFERLFEEDKATLFQSIYLPRRLWHCCRSLGFNCVIVRRELLLFNDYGNLFLDKFLLALHPNVILDFDDDLSAAKREPRQMTRFGRLLFESPTKFADSLRLYSRFITGSNYLKRLLVERNSKVADSDIITIPTCVDYSKHPAKVYDEQSEFVTFGWIGSATNHYLLDIVTPVLSQVAKKHKIRFVVITNDGYVPNADFEVVRVPWSLETEIESLCGIDIGLMPLYDNPEERGKCGFKLIQYMGLGIVSIASAVSVNSEIVDDGENGFLVHRESDWLRVIEEVLARRAEFSGIGAAARAKIQSHYSFEANRQQYLDFVRVSVT